MSYTAKQVLLGYPTDTSVTIGASQTASPISTTFRISATDRCRFLIDVTYSSATVTNAVSIIFQDSIDGGTTWNTKKSTSVTTVASSTLKTQTYLVEVAGDQTYLPLRPLGRVVVTSGVADTITVTSVMVTRSYE